MIAGRLWDQQSSDDERQSPIDALRRTALRSWSRCRDAHRTSFEPMRPPRRRRWFSTLGGRRPGSLRAPCRAICREVLRSEFRHFFGGCFGHSLPGSCPTALSIEGRIVRSWHRHAPYACVCVDSRPAFPDRARPAYSPRISDGRAASVRCVTSGRGPAPERAVCVLGLGLDTARAKSMSDYCVHAISEHVPRQHDPCPCVKVRISRGRIRCVECCCRNH